LRPLPSEGASYSAGLQPGKTMPRTQEVLDSRCLTTEYLCKVDLATIREGFNHCGCPREVVERFTGADSIALPDGYEDDQDLGEVVLPTCQGERDPETGKQVADELLTSDKLAPAVNQIHGYKLPHFQCLESSRRSERSSVSASM
jgi:hypothetical protein